MSNEKLIIPKKCKVGFNLRNDTYTGKLGYIIYNDGKVWRKETSWESWRQKAGNEYWNPSAGKKEIVGPEINPIEFDNIPMTGFVLNKKAGGYSTGWSHRSTYCRVFDPRGFEFEINIPNLLFILQETNSMKGKGLEGEFVYSWDGKDLVLLPCDSQDYQKSQSFTDLQTKKVSTKELILGATYLTNRAEKVIYLGKLDYFRNCSKYTDTKSYLDTSRSKQYIFRKEDTRIIPKKSISGYIKDCVDESRHLEYAKFVAEYDNSINGQKIVSIETEDLKIEDFYINNNYYVSLVEDVHGVSNFLLGNLNVNIRVNDRYDIDSASYKKKFYMDIDNDTTYAFDKLERINVYRIRNQADQINYYDSLEELLNSNQLSKTFFVTEKGNRIINDSY